MKKPPPRSPKADPLDVIDLDAMLSDEEKDVRAMVRRVATDLCGEHIAQWYEDGQVPARELAREFGKAGLLGSQSGTALLKLGNRDPNLGIDLSSIKKDDHLDRFAERYLFA